MSADVMPALSKKPPGSFFEIVTDHWTEPFWRAAAAHRLVAPRCASCGRFRMPPTPFCPHCQSQQIDWVALTGNGSIYSYTIVARAITPDMEAHLPYVPAVIELEGAPGVRLISNVIGAPLGEIAVGRAVTVRWHDHREGIAIPMFALANL